MGKSLNGKELGKGISQRKEDGLYVARFINRFGKRQSVYNPTYNGVQKKLRIARQEDEKALNVVRSNMTLDEWFEKWIVVCKQNCRDNTKDTYTRHYNRVREALGWRKLNKLNLVIMQDAINNLETDNQRKNSKKILVDLLETAYASDLITKNIAKQITTDITREEKHAKRVLTVAEQEIFLAEAQNTAYYNLFVVAIETGMRIGELTGLQWKDIDFENKIIHVRHSLTYFSNKGKYVFQMHQTKTHKGLRDIPLTGAANDALHQQIFVKEKIVNRGKKPMEGYEDLVFVTRNNRPTTQFLVSECIEAILRRIHKKNPELVFERVTPHCFRHTFATRWLEAGIPIKTVSEILGHSQLQLTTDLYMHVTADNLFQGLEQFERSRYVG